MRRREVQFKVSDLVLADLRKERFPRGEYNKLKLKNIGPCKILRKIATNEYELELLTYIDISPIFNVAYLYPYKGDNTEELEEIQEHAERWRQQFPTVKPLEIDRFLDRKVAKRTKNK